VALEMFSNLSRHGENLDDSIIDLMRNTHAPEIPIKIAVRI
jgi:hypothetical protein